jgi:hypothetical protein
MPTSNSPTPTNQLTFSPSAPSLGGTPSFQVDPGIMAAAANPMNQPIPDVGLGNPALTFQPGQGMKTPGNGKKMGILSDIMNAAGEAGIAALKAMPEKKGKVFNPVYSTGLGSAPISGARTSAIPLGSPTAPVSPYRSAIMDLLRR